MAFSSLFGIKLFRNSSRAANAEPTLANYTTVANLAGNGDANARIPNELSLMEACKFMDDVGLTKKLNEYNKIMKLLAGSVDPKPNGEFEATPAIVAAGSYLSFASEFYTQVYNSAFNNKKTI
jgi:hypothetical protein